ncbi:MAG TPA: hypothetical protein VMM35_10780, partial [Longimicrobiales bacterium]|nr:hypothetical protein [Longimicrobiales bacterium]
MHRRSDRPAAAGGFLALVVACTLVAPPLGAQVETSDLVAAPAAEWLTYGRDYAETHYSPLDQIDTDNVAGLEIAWSWDLPKTGARLESVPLISDGVMFATGPRSFVFALDA